MKNILIVSITSLFILVSCGGKNESVVNTEKPITVELSNQSTTANQSFFTASGQIESENNANLSTRMMGYVTKVHVKVGQRVGKGQTLVSINNTDLLAKKAQVEASIMQATAAHNSAKKDFERFQNLFANQSASQKELDDMTTRYEMAKAGLNAANHMKNEVMAQFAYSNVSAPFGGVITNTFINEGDMANPGMPLVSIEGSGKTQVVAMIPENYISQIQKGMAVKIHIKSIDKTIDGKVDEVSLSAKHTGGQYLVKVNLDQTDKSILSGMFTNIQFPIKAQGQQTDNAKTSAQVLEQALVKSGQLTGVYTIGSNQTAILRWLRLGKKIGDSYEVLSGLSQDEVYIVSAQGKLYNGVKVEVKK